MSVDAVGPVRDNGLSRTTLQIGSGLTKESLAAVVHALQRVPGVLTVDADADNAQAFVAHDAAVPAAALVAAVCQTGSAARSPGAAIVVGAFELAAAPPTSRRKPFLSAVGLAAVVAIIVIDVSLANSPEKRWLFIIPVVVLWAFVLLRTMLTRGP